MSAIEELPWDTKLLGAHSGRVANSGHIPDCAELSGYRFVHVRIPQEDIELVWTYERLGFRYVTLDFTLEKPLLASGALEVSVAGMEICILRKSRPEFFVEGFRLEGSRLMIDPELKRRLGVSFWDRMIEDHCTEFADVCLCAVGKDRGLQAFASCFERQDALDLFLFVVHPEYQDAGLGGSLMHAADTLARQRNTSLSTSVVAPNVKAMNFYARNGFRVRNAHIVMHYQGSDND